MAMNTPIDFCRDVVYEVSLDDRLDEINSGGCGWFAYYMARELAKRWPELQVRFLYFDRHGLRKGASYSGNILGNASVQYSGQANTASCSHVALKVVSSEGYKFYVDAAGVYNTENELLYMHDSCDTWYLEEEFEMPPAIYRKGALRFADQWNCWYNVREGNKAIREILTTL